MIAGGPYTVRAYDLGVLSGDTGVLGTLELQHTLGVLMGGAWQATAFFDSEHIVVNKKTWAAGINTATLNGTGLGLWISDEIVQRHQGRLSMRSSQAPHRHGTVFSLFLPLTQSAQKPN